MLIYMIVLMKLQMSSGFCQASSLCQGIDKEFSIYVNHHKGHGAIFQAWMKDNHHGNLLLHVERACSGGRQDIASMAVLATHWNCNCYVKFLDKMKMYSDKGENILVNNLHTMLTYLEMVAMVRMWSIIHLSIAMLIRYLAAKSHKRASIKRGEEYLHYS